MLFENEFWIIRKAKVITSWFSPDFLSSVSKSPVTKKECKATLDTGLSKTDLKFFWEKFTYTSWYAFIDLYADQLSLIFLTCLHMWKSNC